MLLAHGPSAVTHARVAEQAGIARATVYRHWPRTDQLLAEAMRSVPLPFFDSPTTPTRDWLVRELTAIARELDHHDVRSVATTLANTALWEADMDARREGLAGMLRARLTEALEEDVELHRPTPCGRPGDRPHLLPDHHRTEHLGRRTHRSGRRLPRALEGLTVSSSPSSTRHAGAQRGRERVRPACRRG